jgi:hypothetical protein
MSYNNEESNNYSNPLTGISKFFSMFIPSLWNEKGQNVG